MKVEKFQLKNGLKVLLQESHKSPVVSIQVWVRTGSADERKGEEGISHFIEHLVFKGTKSFKMGEIAAMIEGSGGELNAYTSFDQTVFYVTISQNFLDIGMKALSEMMGFPLFDSQEIDNEREVVIEEIKRGEDSLGRVASQHLFRTAYQKHPYRVPVIGYEKNVRSWSAQKIRKYYRDRYTPANMFLVVTGAFDSKTIKEKVFEYFSIFKKTPLRNSQRKNEPNQIKPQIQVLPSKFEQDLSYIAWKVPAMKHKDIPALELLSLVLGYGDSSKLVSRLRIQEAIVNSIGSGLFSTKDLGLLTISMTYAPQNLDKALEGILEVLKVTLQGQIKSEEMARAVTQLESDNYYGIETVDGLSRKIGEAEFFMKDPKYFDEYLKKIKKVKVTDLIRVARKYLNPKHLTIAGLDKNAPEEVQKNWQKWQAEFSVVFKESSKVKFAPPKASKKIAMGKTALAGKTKASDLKTIILSNGVRVLIKPSEGGVLSAKATFLGGTRSEPKPLLGLAELAGRTWTAGTENRSEMEIYQESESLAAGVGATVGRNSFGLSLDAIKPFESESRDLFLDILTAPTFTKDSIDRERIVQMEQIKTRRDNPAQLASRAFVEDLFGRHPYSRDQLGTMESLNKITEVEIQAYWSQIAHPKNLTICLSGPIEEKEWIRQIEKYTHRLHIGSRIQNKDAFEGPRENTFRFQEIKKEQSHLIVGFPGLTLTDPDRFTLQIIQSILAGQGGRLFLELRDKNSLAYSVSPMKMEGTDAGYFGAYIGCSPEKVIKAKQMIHKEFEKLCNEKVSAHELERAQKYLIGRHDIDLQRVSSIAASILYDDIYGIDPMETFNLKDRYFKITSDDVLRVAQKIFRQKHVTSLAGPTNPFAA
jgi:zinc protease